jgi:CPA2 family monovalent cation:H+ antiporter-2
LAYPMQILVITAGVFILKCLVAMATTLLLGMPIRTAVMTGLSLSQIGEFSFVLASFGFALGLGNEFLNQIFLSVAIITMGATPFLMRLSSPMMNLLFKLPISFKPNLQPTTYDKVLKEHVVIIGYGVSGKNLARSTKESGIPYVVLDLNPDTVRMERKRGEPIHFGDTSREHVLHHVHADKASVIAILANDPIASLRIVETVRKMNPKGYIIVRTQFLAQMQMMFQLGADDVISDEFGSSVEIFSRVLHHYEAPPDKIEKLVAELRAEGYEMLRHQYIETTIFSGIREHISDITTHTFVVGKNSTLVGKSILESQLRSQYGLTILLIRRDNETIYNIDPDLKLNIGDIVVVIGKKEDITKGRDLFQP